MRSLRATSWRWRNSSAQASHRNRRGHAAPHHRHFGRAQGGHRFRSALHAAVDQLSRPQRRRGEFRPGVPRPEARAIARPGRPRSRECRDLDPQRHASRRAVSFPSDHGQRHAGNDDRPGAARMVLQRCREARFPRQARWLRLHCRRREARARPHRLSVEAARHRADEYHSRQRLRAAGFHRSRLRLRPCGDAAPAQPGCPRHRHERLELGCAVQLHGKALRRNRRREPDLGRTQGRARDRLLPHGEARPTWTRFPPRASRSRAFR